MNPQLQAYQKRPLSEFAAADVGTPADLRSIKAMPIDPTAYLKPMEDGGMRPYQQRIVDELQSLGDQRVDVQFIGKVPSTGWHAQMLAAAIGMYRFKTCIGCGARVAVRLSDGEIIAPTCCGH